MIWIREVSMDAMDFLVETEGIDYYPFASKGSFGHFVIMDGTLIVKGWKNMV